MSARSKIVNKIVEHFNTELDGITYPSNIYANSIAKQIFWDEVNQYPLISVTAGTEYREYLPAAFKWGFLEVSIKIYVEDEDAPDVLEQFLEDIEKILDANNELAYDTGQITEQISILSISTDEGVLAPLGVGEIIIQIRYDIV